jgi:hypothetical protein
LDNLVCAQQQRRWNRDTKGLRRFQVNQERELGRLLDCKIGGLGASQNLVNEECKLAIVQVKSTLLSHNRALRALYGIARGLSFWPMRTDVVVFNTLAIRGHSKRDH